MAITGVRIVFIELPYSNQAWTATTPGVFPVASRMASDGIFTEYWDTTPADLLIGTRNDRTAHPAELTHMSESSSESRLTTILPVIMEPFKPSAHWFTYYDYAGTISHFGTDSKSSPKKHISCLEKAMILV